MTEVVIRTKDGYFAVHGAHGVRDNSDLAGAKRLKRSAIEDAITISASLQASFDKGHWRILTLEEAELIETLNKI